MTFQRLMLVCMLVILGSVGAVFGDQPLSDPYLILTKHFEAIGGLDRIKSQKTVYKEGTISIEGAGLEGTFKQWSERPLKLRQETDLKVVKSVSGDNGEFSWLVDANGKVLIQRDEATIKEREVRKLMAEYEYLDPKSQHFKLVFKGVERVNGIDCYVVEMTNKIDKNIQLDYYDKTNFYLLKTVLSKPDREHHVYYSDFRRVDEMILPFHEVAVSLPTNEKTLVEYMNYVFNVNIDAVLFEPPQEDVEDFVFLNGKSAEDVPFEFIEDHLYIPVNLLGKERLWVLDCGASVNVIDSSFAAELGLVFEGPVKGQGASGVVNLYYVTLPVYLIGGIRFQEQKVVAFSFSHLFQRVLGMDVVGILGYDFLSRFVTKIDYAKEKLSFYDPKKFEYSGKGMIIDSPLSEDRMLNLPITVDKQYSGRWRVDIGAPDIDFHYPYAKDHDLLNRDGIDVVAGDAAGYSMIRLSQFKTVELEGFTIKNPIIGTPHQEGTGAFAEESAIGNIGNSFLRNFVVYLDYRNQRVILEKGDDFGREFPRSKSGLQFMYNADHDVEVQFVSPKTPAEEAGFKKGDIIKSINGIDVQYFDGIIALRKLMREKAGTTYTIEISRDKKIKKIQLPLRELY